MGRTPACGVDGCVGEGSGIEAEVRQQLEEPAAERHPQDPVGEELEPRRIYDTCAYCHGNKRNAFVGFKGGDHYSDYATPFLISDPLPDNDMQGEFWPDGRPNRFNRPQALTLSGCFKAGAIACTNCHVAHGSRNEFSLKVEHQPGPQRRRALHAVPFGAKSREPGAGTGNLEPASPQARKPSFSGPGLSAHTFHAPDSAGSRCISCHMSDVNWRLLIRRRDHTFQPPVPENTAQFGIPNACTTCHDDRTPEWAAKQMTEWWGDGERRAQAVTLADTMYRAGSGDTTTLPGLAKLAVDRSAGLPGSRERRRIHWTAGFGMALWRDDARQFTDSDVVRRWFYERSTSVWPRRSDRRTTVERRRTPSNSS